MPRPHQNKSIREIESLFAEARGRESALREIADELHRRSTTRAQQLLIQVEEALLGPRSALPQREARAAYQVTPTQAVPSATQSPPDGSRASPDCPACGGPMKLRTAGRGPRAGQKFWGCSAYPACRGIRNLDDDEAAQRPDGGDTRGEVPNQRALTSAAGSAASLPVTWVDTSTNSAWIVEYVAVGAMPGLLQDELRERAEHLDRCLTQCLLLSRRDRDRHATEHARLVSGLAIKLLQRGRAPLPTLGVEWEAIRRSALAERVEHLEAGRSELGWAAHAGAGLALSADDLISASCVRAPFVLDPTHRPRPGVADALLQSEEEVRFIDRWVTQTLGDDAGHWFLPQASLDRLLEAYGREAGGARRVDFLFAHPGGPPLVIEIDGAEHAQGVAVDEQRDSDLRAVGIVTVRIPNSELRHLDGPGLDAVAKHCRPILKRHRVSREPVNPLAGIVLDCASAAKVQLALMRAVGHGWLSAGGSWEVAIEGGSSVSGAAVCDALELLAGFDVLYGGASVPARCRVTWGDDEERVWVRGDGDAEVADLEPPCEPESLRIRLEMLAGPFHEAGGQAGQALPDFVLRSAFVPVSFATEHTFDFRRRPIAPEGFPAAEEALRTFLRHVFRKYDFRPMQGEAIYNALRQNDCIVLLPTGAGKSIIYQLAGLLMPGVTLVVDPLISLIEDQVEGLATYGIDRAAGIASNLAGASERARLLLRVERGEYQFVLHSPERMQSPQFRAALRALAESSLVNLAVIDEAHCVSEWGHDFRPAYLNLASNLRRFGADRDDRPPPLLALTGTASRAVLRDVLAELGIDRNRSDALIRPSSFDRPELGFDVVRTSPEQDEHAALRGVLNALPSKFGLPRTEIYRIAGRNTASGLIFVPWANGMRYGIVDVGEQVRRATSADVTYYSGTALKAVPGGNWDTRKRENATQFKRNQVPILVATKAFGMGIDKPNIRYTIHFGMPASLESFYQEAGRAGRDRKRALCTVVFSEYDEQRTDELLDPALDLESLRSRYEQVRGARRLDDDVTRTLFFHLNGFTGADGEIADVEAVLEELGDLGTRRRVELPFWPDDGNTKRKEKAIFRLLKVGVIRDYEVEFGAQRYTVHIDAFDLEHCKRKLLGYVQAAQPAKAKIFAEELESVDTDQPARAALELSVMLIRFTYDVIERSRRRMIQEAVLLARHARSDADIRSRLLDYLQEGLGAERITQLLDSQDVNLGQWMELLEKMQTPMDAGELRGLCIRALESYPDHPGLLLTRASVESMCSDADDRVCAQGLASALELAVERYRLPVGAVADAAQAILELAQGRARELGAALALALAQMRAGHGRSGELAQILFPALSTLDDERVRAVVATARLADSAASMESAVSAAAARYANAAVSAMLSGERA